MYRAKQPVPVLEVLLGRKQTRYLGSKDFTVVRRLSQVADDLAIAEYAHRNDHKVNYIIDFWDVRTEAGHARMNVGTDQAEQQPRHNQR